MDKNIVDLNEYLMKEYNAIAVDCVENVDKPPYNHSAEVIYMLNCFKFHPDDALIDKMMSDVVYSQKIKEVLLNLSNAEYNMEVFKECKFPVGDTDFAKRFIDDSKYYNAHKVFPASSFKGTWGTFSNSYLNRIPRTFLLKEATEEVLQSALGELLDMKSFKELEARALVGLSEAYDIDDLAESISMSDILNKKLEEANKCIQICILKRKKEELFNAIVELQAKVMDGKIFDDINALKFKPFEKYDMLKKHFEFVVNISNKLMHKKQEYLLFIEHSYACVIGDGNITQQELEKEIVDAVGKMGIKIIDMETQTQTLKDISFEFEETLKAMMVNRWEVLNRSNGMNVFAIFMQQEELQTIRKNLEVASKRFIEFRNAYYNPIFGREETTMENVNKFVDAYIDSYIESEPFDFDFDGFCADLKGKDVLSDEEHHEIITENEKEEKNI